jgi:hypothetical protein
MRSPASHYSGVWYVIRLGVGSQPAILVQSTAYESSGEAHAGAGDDSALAPSGVAVDQSIPPFVIEARTAREAMHIWMVGRMEDAAGRPLTELHRLAAGRDLPVQTIRWEATVG